MYQSFVMLAKLFLLCVVLNLLRYFVFGFLEGILIMGPLSSAMQQSSSYFNTNFQTIDWITSFFYNFMMWFAVTLAFSFAVAHLRGTMIVRSLKVYALMWVMFASISAIYMNHYSHPKDFYIYNIVDGVLIFALMGIANGLLYPLFFKQHTALIDA
ncbi:MAG: hypothetical protein HYW57_10155 [Ignavibacteriales bacterium]|nr:hypothetical protein [Ignavibacteriales bacterium]